MWHPYFTMPANSPYGSTVSATFEFFLADQDAVGFVDWTSTANAVAGYSIGTQTLTWTAIPEPGSVGMFLTGGFLLMLAYRKKRRGQSRNGLTTAGAADQSDHTTLSPSE
jgi:hypothetical protein